MQAFAYDAYGNHLAGTGLTSADAAFTNLLYSGEWMGKHGQQYLRGRFYDPSTGRFNRLDPFSGNMQDPQSLHKYLYTHANPVMGMDPTGESLISLAISVAKGAGISGASAGIAVAGLSGVSSWASGGSFLQGAWRGTTTGLAVTLIAAQSGGVWNPKFGSAMVQIAAGGVFGTLIDLIVHTTRSDDDVTLAHLDRWFWQSANAAAIGIATKGFFKYNEPRHAAMLAFGTEFSKSGLPIVRDIAGNWWSGNDTDWAATGSQFSELLIDSAYTAVKAYVTAHVNDKHGFEEWDPVSKQMIATVLWGGWDVLARNTSYVLGK